MPPRLIFYNFSSISKSLHPPYWYLALFTSFFFSLRPWKFHILLHWSALAASTDCPPSPVRFSAITCVWGGSEVAHQGSGRPLPYPMSLEQLQNADQLSVRWEMLDPKCLIILISILHNNTRLVFEGKYREEAPVAFWPCLVSQARWKVKQIKKV